MPHHCRLRGTRLQDSRRWQMVDATLAIRSLQPEVDADDLAPHIQIPCYDLIGRYDFKIPSQDDGRSCLLPALLRISGKRPTSGVVWHSRDTACR